LRKNFVVRFRTFIQVIKISTCRVVGYSGVVPCVGQIFFKRLYLVCPLEDQIFTVKFIVKSLLFQAVADLISLVRNRVGLCEVRSIGHSNSE
jgi:hypothetical protein